MGAPLSRPCVLVFAGLDPSGGAGIQADIESIGATGSHALPVVTALTVQDNDRAFAIHPVEARVLRHQSDVLSEKIPVSAVKIGIVGNRANADTIADVICRLRETQPDLPVVLDTVLGSGKGYTLTEGDAVSALAPLIPLATLVTPNLPEMARLSPGTHTLPEQAKQLLARGCQHVLLKGGHGDDPQHVTNYWFSAEQERRWVWPRLDGGFHGSGCTLASLFAGLLAQGLSMEAVLQKGQAYCQTMLENAYIISEGQRIPGRGTGMNHHC
ncbi:MAG: hydroxymethylpyrimidine/phosphomethylpyrimidine kinase [Burkholderiaceae bacterium]|jgi:hydroxymethylpyrimidine/phosphomethylpyrimidine kinase|nr:hydroxymethylpyrimidine/phosphomethylpyrimidine kinase [Burkholderiaceae bacterium]